MSSPTVAGLVVFFVQMPIIATALLTCIPLAVSFIKSGYEDLSTQEKQDRERWRLKLVFIVYAITWFVTVLAIPMPIPWFINLLYFLVSIVFTIMSWRFIIGSNHPEKPTLNPLLKGMFSLLISVIILGSMVVVPLYYH